MLSGGGWRPERGVVSSVAAAQRAESACESCRLAHALLARVGAQNLSCVVHAHVHVCTHLYRRRVFSHLRLFCHAGAHGTQRLVGPWPGRRGCGSTSQLVVKYEFGSIQFAI